MADLRAIFGRLVDSLKPDEDAGLGSTYRRLGRRQHRRRVSAAVLAVLIAAGGLGVGAIAILKATRVPPAVPSSSGVIAFEVDVLPDGQFASDAHRDALSTTEIYLVNPDGSGLRRLTGGSLNFGDPAWSPDGTTIAVDGQHSGQGGIYLLDADGTHVRQITACGPPRCRDLGPTWSPDGRQLAFQRLIRPSTVIVVVNADGSNPRVLPCPPTLWPCTPPAWSPDGQWLVFGPCCREEGPIPLNSDGMRVGGPPLHEMHPDGTGLRQLSLSVCPPQCYGDGRPAWSPDGKELAFARFVGASVNVFVMQSDGAGAQQLTHCDTAPCAVNRNPVWSPDGRQIAFIHDESSQGHADQTLEVMNSDGSDVRVVTRLPGLVTCCLSWSRGRVAIPTLSPSEAPSASPAPTLLPVYLAIMALYFAMTVVTERVAVRLGRGRFAWFMYALLVPLVSCVHVLILARLADRRSDQGESQR